MQFKYPEILWALFALVIPLIIHLFNLRKFSIVKFTNVTFLKSITQNNRKRSKLKKWITLLLRLLAFASIVIAFAQPMRYVIKEKKETQIVIYLDNSYSMQSQGPKGKLLEREIQNLLEELSEDIFFTIFTNNDTYVNISKNDIKNTLLSLKYSGTTLDMNSIFTKAYSFFNLKNELPKKFIFISDMKNFDSFPDISDKVTVEVVQPFTENKNNTAIKNVTVEVEKQNKKILKIELQSDLKKAIIPVAIYNDEKLISKLQAQIENNIGNVSVSIDNIFFDKGSVFIEDNSLDFDNSFYFNFQKENSINVLAINQQEDSFLKRIFSREEFNFSSIDIKKLNIKQIDHQEIIILNEVLDITSSLQIALRNFIENKGHLVIIPPKNISASNYNVLLSTYLNFRTEKEKELNITQINFSNPLYKNVFTKKVTNFKYPKVNSYYNTESSLSTVLNFENGIPFLLSDGKISVFTAPINQENSNFQASPLIVPTFYNMAQQSFFQPPIYYTIGQPNTFDVNISLDNDKVLELRNKEYSIRPLQQQTANKVRVFTEETPNLAGYYNVRNDDQILLNLSYNYDRKESFGTPIGIPKGINLSSNMEEAMADINKITHPDMLWKVFVILAGIFLLLEMLVLNYKK